MSVEIIHGDCLEVMAAMAAGSIDAIVTDPPYHLISIVKRFGKEGSAPAKAGATGAYKRHSTGFMGKQWDGGDVAFQPETWRLCLDLLKPGGHMLVFGGTRTYHRMACAIEDAGFEIRDTIMWLYGSGFPKSHDVSKGIDKAAGKNGKRAAVGSAVRRIRPGADQDKDGTWEKLEDREYQPHDYAPATDAAKQWQGWGTALKPAFEPIILVRKPIDGTVAANVLAHGTGALNIDGCRVALDGDYKSKPNGRPSQTGLADGYDPVSANQSDDKGRWPANVIHDGSDEVLAAFAVSGESASAIGKPRQGPSGDGWGMTATGAEYTDAGTAARFFYTAKADKGDRLGSKHPTVKPVDLIAYLCRLITPPGGTVLDPFAGSGTTAMACIRESFGCIVIEREAEYIADIKARLAHVEGADTPLFVEASA